MCALLFTGLAFAQEQRGSIEGVVKDTSGAVLPGVTVEARSPSGATVTTTSGTDGGYRFPSLAPGSYTVTANLSGFSPRTTENVPVNLGQVKKVDFALSVAGVAESVQVTAESPLVDVKQTARQTNIRAEQVELLPKGRDFTTLVTQAPGANTEAKLGGLSIDGASAGENRYIIDGIETTNLRNGTSGKNVIADFVEEVQVKSSGYTAEFGGATGGVVNVVTKSGTNDLHGNGLFYFQGSALSAGDCAGESAGTTTGTQTLACAGGRQVLRHNPTATNVAEYIEYPEDDMTRIEPGFALGGPIVRDRAWFFGAYQPALTTIERSVDETTSGNPSAAIGSSTQKQQVQYATGNVTGQWSDNLRTRVAFNNSWSRRKGLLPSLNGADAEGTNYGKTSTFPNYSISGNLDYVPSSRFFMGVRGGYYFQDQYDANVTEEPRIIFSTGNNLAFTSDPALARSTLFQNIPSNNKVIRDQMTRLYFQADSTVYGHLGGEHQLKFGVQLDRVGNNVLSGESANLVRLRWDSLLVSGDPTSRGAFGYYQVRSNGVNPKQGFITEGDIHTNNIGLFIQDAWTINNRLTINAGLRTERERVPTYTAGQDIPEFGVEFDFGDKLAPRVGFAYDVNADGRTKVFGSWGVFYDIFKLELPRGSFGGDKWLEYYYTLDTVDWRNLTAASNCPDASQAVGTSGTCAGTLLRGPVDFRHPSFGSDAIDPDLKPMRMQEASAGLEHQLNDVVAVSARYVHKQLDRAIEDAGSLDPQGNEIYIIANPGEGLTAFAHPGVPYPKAKRDYDSVEFAAEKRLQNNWYLRASYLWSRLEGNYTGLSQSDEQGRTSPNVGRVFDYPLMMFQDGGTAAFGPLPTDRPHQFKTQFIYAAPFGTAIGLNQYLASGIPVTREIGIYPPNTLPVQYLGRGSDGRTDMYSQTDLQIQHEFRVAGDRRLQLTFNVLNLFDQKTETGRFSTYQYIGGVIPDEDAFYAGQETLAQLIADQDVPQDTRFLMSNQFQWPIEARFGVKFVF
jgi:outer membrane receptor protein involved in Fe transport